jgi:hypothetical protein
MAQSEKLVPHPAWVEFFREMFSIPLTPEEQEQCRQKIADREREWERRAGPGRAA